MTKYAEVPAAVEQMLRDLVAACMKEWNMGKIGKEQDPSRGELVERICKLENDEKRRAKVEALARAKAFEPQKVRGIQVFMTDEPAPSPNTDIAFIEMPSWLIKWSDPTRDPCLKVVTEDRVYGIELKRKGRRER